MAGEIPPALSERQKQVLSLIDRRLTIKEIAAELGISETRVNQHINALKRRLAANTHRELAARYQERFSLIASPPFRNTAGRETQLANESEPGSSDARGAFASNSTRPRLPATQACLLTSNSCAPS